MPSVKMLTQECGPAGSFGIGELRPVTFEQGEMLVATKHAEWVDKGLSPAEAAAAEAAAEAEAEAAAAEEKRKAADAAKPKQPARR